MNLQSVTIVAPSGESIVLTVGASIKYRLISIDGIDPVKADIVSTDYGQIPGSRYQSSRRGKRNITMALEIISDGVTNSVSSLRRDLYRIVMPESLITLKFQDVNGSIYTTTGYVEELVTPSFTKSPSADITIQCMDPDFINSVDTVVNLNTVATAVDTSISYNGTAPAGFVLEITPTAAINEWTLYVHDAKGGYKELRFAMAVSAGQKLTINTRPREKGIWRTVSGAVTSVLYGMDGDFPVLYPGYNYVRLQLAGTVMPYTITYRERYGGL